MKMNPNLTWKLVEKRYQAEKNPQHKRTLELVLTHMKAEAHADIEGVVATLTEKPRYVTHDLPEAEEMNPRGSRDAERKIKDEDIVPLSI